VADYKILLVDDFEEFRRFVSSILQKRAEFHVIGQASDGLEAVQRAGELQPDLILLDIGLPGLNGIEACRQIRKASPNSRILFLSQESSAEVVREALSLGAHGYLWKSDADELLLAMDQVLQGEKFVSRRLRPRTDVGIDKERPTDYLGPMERSPLPPQEGETCRTHEVAFYRDDASFLDGFTRFIEAALKTSNPVLLLATESHRSSLVQRLQARGWDITAAIQKRSFISLDASDTLSTFMINDWPDPVRFLKVAGDLIRQAATVAKGKRPRVAVCGECAPTLWAQGKAEAAIQLEHLWDDVARRSNLDTLCGYLLSDSQRKENGPIFKRICAQHSAVYFL
jgi:DNA-binding NarL/FixJ family response regulator